MTFTRTAAILALSTAVSFGMAQTSSTMDSTPHQGVGNQHGAGTSAGNSSNGGAGTTQPSTKKHKRHTKASSTPATGSNDTTPSGTSPAPPSAGTPPQR